MKKENVASNADLDTIVVLKRKGVKGWFQVDDVMVWVSRARYRLDRLHELGLIHRELRGNPIHTFYYKLKEQYPELCDATKD